MSGKRCAACDERFTLCRHVSDQRYCSKPACQRERRRRWQREKLSRDSDYRAASRLPSTGVAAVRQEGQVLLSMALARDDQADAENPGH